MKKYEPGFLARQRELDIMTRLYESETGITAHNLSNGIHSYHMSSILSDLKGCGLIKTEFVNKKTVVYFLTARGVEYMQKHNGDK